MDTTTPALLPRGARAALVALLAAGPCLAQGAAPGPRAPAAGGDPAALAAPVRWRGISAAVGGPTMLPAGRKRDAFGGGAGFRVSYVHPVSRIAGLSAGWEEQGLAADPEELAEFYTPRPTVQSGGARRVRAFTVGFELSSLAAVMGATPYMSAGVSVVRLKNEPFRYLLNGGSAVYPGRTDVGPGATATAGVRLRVSGNVSGLAEGGYLFTASDDGFHLASLRAGVAYRL